MDSRLIAIGESFSEYNKQQYVYNFSLLLVFVASPLQLARLASARYKVFV